MKKIQASKNFWFFFQFHNFSMKNTRNENLIQKAINCHFWVVFFFSSRKTTKKDHPGAPGKNISASGGCPSSRTDSPAQRDFSMQQQNANQTQDHQRTRNTRGERRHWWQNNTVTCLLRQVYSSAHTIATGDGTNWKTATIRSPKRWRLSNMSQNVCCLQKLLSSTTCVRVGWCAIHGVT